ncbi:MAG TPA: coproporphyrinogen III oxidase [Bacillaceae bacterium]
MHIQIDGLRDEYYQRALQLIANLFFEESVMDFSGEMEHPELIAAFTTGEMSVTAELTRVQDGSKYHASRDVVILEGMTAKEIRKEYKKALSHVFLSVLQDCTGMIQKWGILTGMRPTKLMHRKNRTGISIERARQELKEEYMLTDEKIQLMKTIVDRQLSVLPDLYDIRNEVSIYIGIPFCPTKCAYCTFPAYAILGKQGRVDSFLSGLHYEMRETGRWLKEKGIAITTVYYGGGTPTSISAEEMDALYEEMYDSFPGVENIREITVEAGRPDTITTEKLDVLKKWNIDRISINPQSYTQETLKAIGRHHTVEETIEKFHLARNMGMNNINMDLIIGLPGEGVPELQHSLDETAKLMPESLTVHTLSFKRASEMTRNKDRYQVAGREEAERMMGLAEHWTKENGYVPYYLYRQKNILGNLENVGYAMPGQESLYNIIIMEEVQTIIGIGCGAASKFIHPRTGAITHLNNPKDPKSYNESFKEYTERKIAILEDLFSEESSPV